MPSERENGIQLRSGGLQSLTFMAEYRTGTSDPIGEFYSPCLSKSNCYKRAVGYFRSSIYGIVGPEVLDFARCGGKVSLICSPDLTPKDQDSMTLGYTTRERLAEEQISIEIDKLLSDSAHEWSVRVLGTLIAVGCLEVKIAVRPESHGLYHEKIGIFCDPNGDIVSFIGSSNESWSGWHAQGNFESIEVFCSWHHSEEQKRAIRHLQNFDSLWLGRTPEVATIPFPEAAKRKLCAKAADNIDDLEREAANKWTKDVLQKRRVLLPHQRNAINAWIAQNRRGIFEHATGSGKTLTALRAAQPHIGSGLPVIILVPSELLLVQWEQEVKKEFPDVAIMLAGGGNDRWKETGRLRRMTSADAVSGRVVIATMQTAATDLFRHSVSQGSHLMLIADEVHQIGSLFNSKSMHINSGFRLGLSATPHRYGDPDGTARIFHHFGPVVPPPFTLADAIAAGRLVDYQYYPHPIRLNAEESDSWKAITRAIRFEIGNAEGHGLARISERAKSLLIRRARIAKKAIGKAPLAAQVLQKTYQDNQSWLVYCEDAEQLSETMAQILEIGIKPVEYHTGMHGDREATLDWFRQHGGVLVSIKCLDEGIDIPSVSHALILASSQNPRQFIQRRGRVLRHSQGKVFACIHDAIVVPTDLQNEPEQGSLLKAEFLRAIEFAASAMNKSAGGELRAIARQAGFDPDEKSDIGIEEDDTL